MTDGNRSIGPLRERVLARETTVGTFCGLGSAVATEICAAGLDWVLIDLEHGSSTDADLLPQLLAVSGTRTTPLVRVTSANRTAVSKALDLGAGGIMFPRIEGVEDARAAIAMARYPPTGVRGIASQVRSARFGAVPVHEIGTLGEDILGVIQIETLGALRDAESIAAIEGVDVLFVGPGDLSYALAAPGRFDAPEYLQALDRIAHAAESAGVAAGVLARDIRDAATYLERGFTFLAVGSDSGFLRAGVNALSDWASTSATAR